MPATQAANHPLVRAGLKPNGFKQSRMPADVMNGVVPASREDTIN